MGEKLQTEMDQKYLSALKILNYDVRHALEDFLILNISGKLIAFKDECDAFKKKYGLNFASFEKKLNKKINKENFQEEDDYMAWKFAEESRQFLQTKLDELS